MSEDLEKTKIIMSSLGSKIRTLRRSRGISQEELADLAQLDRSYLGGVERGERNISLVNITKISLALNITLENLFKDING